MRLRAVKQTIVTSIRPDRPLIAAAIAVGLAGCDPVINVAGANFPAWLLCLLAGATAAALCRPVLFYSGLEPYLGPAALIYSSLAVMFALIVWIIFFNRI
jgi:YtcA family